MLLLLSLLSATLPARAGWFSSIEEDLHYYAERGDTAGVAEMLAAGADANKADKDGVTPLCWAAIEGKDAVVEKLLAAGADANKACKDGVTPLLLAAINGKDAMVEKLLAAGAKFDAVRNNYDRFDYESMFGDAELKKATDLIAAKVKLVLTPGLEPPHADTGHLAAAGLSLHSFLTSLQLEHHYDRFVEQGIRTLRDLKLIRSEDEMANYLGMSKKFERRKLLLATKEEL